MIHIVTHARADPGMPSMVISCALTSTLDHVWLKSFPGSQKPSQLASPSFCTHTRLD